MPDAPYKISVHADRQRQCEFALEPGLRRLAEEGQAAGWSETEVASAILGLALARLQQRCETLATEAAAVLARRRGR